jgi:hypothetical protein
MKKDGEQLFHTSTHVFVAKKDYTQGRKLLEKMHGFTGNLKTEFWNPYVAKFSEYAVNSL